MPHFAPSPNRGDQRNNRPMRPASAIKAEIDKMIADFRKANKGADK